MVVKKEKTEDMENEQKAAKKPEGDIIEKRIKPAVIRRRAAKPKPVVAKEAAPKVDAEAKAEAKEKAPVKETAEAAKEVAKEVKGEAKGTEKKEPKAAGSIPGYLP